MQAMLLQIGIAVQANHGIREVVAAVSEGHGI